MAFSTVFIGLFFLLILLKRSSIPFVKKIIWVSLGGVILGASLFLHIQKNDSWGALFADAKIALQTDQFQNWKYAGAQGYPINEFGKMVSATNYERVAWFKVGVQLIPDNPLGYGLVEDSFKRMAKIHWPEVSPNLSHSHSGWLDLILAIGIPGFIMIIGAFIFSMWKARNIQKPWKELVFWGLFSLGALWVTTEVSATVTFAELIFWVCFSAGLVSQQPSKK